MTARQVLCAGAALAMLAGGAAQAQSVQGSLQAGARPANTFGRDRNVNVWQRPRPGYEALGLNAGGFTIWPKLTAGAEYVDNLFASPNDAEADGAFRISPEVEAISNWSRHGLRAYARANFNRFSEHSEQNTETYTAGAAGSLEVSSSLVFDGGGEYSRITEPRTSTASEGQPFPVELDQTSAHAGAAYTLNRLKFSGRLDWNEFNYLNRAGNSPQDDRDRQTLVAMLRADYALSPDTAVFVEVLANERDYRLSSSPIVNGAPVYPNFINRDSKGATVLAGADFDLAALVRGEVAAGYMKQSFEDDQLSDYGGLGLRGKVEWFPTGLTTVTLTATQAIEDASLPEASSYIATSLNLQVDHELLRNLILSATAGYGRDDYRGLDRLDKYFGAGLSASYLMNRRVGLTLSYAYFKKEASGTDPSVALGDFDVNRVSLSFTLQY